MVALIQKAQANKRIGPNVKYTKIKSPPKKKKSPKRKKKSPKKKGRKLIVKMNFPKGKSEYQDAGHSGDSESPKRRSPRLSPQGPIGASRTDDTSLSSAGSSFSHTIIAPKSSSSATVFEPASPFAPTHTSTTKAPTKKKGKYICKYCGLGFRSEDNLFRHEMTTHLDPEGYKEGRSDFAGRTGVRLVSPRTSPTSPPRRKREKYDCQFCLDSFPTREQRDMHEVNKHNAWLHHPSFLAPKLPDRIFSYDW